MLYGGILGWQAKCVPAHGLQYIFALHALIASNDIGDGVIANMAHVQFATGVGEHGEAVKFFSRIVSLYCEAPRFSPRVLQRDFK